MIYKYFFLECLKKGCFEGQKGLFSISKQAFFTRNSSLFEKGCYGALF
jgi:hypothetical protein